MDLDRTKFLLILGADPDKWADRYGLLPFSTPCIDCGQELRTTIPFAQGSLRGLIAPKCSCGSEPPYCIVSADPNKDLF